MTTDIDKFLQRVALHITDKIKGKIVLPDNEKDALIAIKSHLTLELVKKSMDEVIERDWQLLVLFHDNDGVRAAFAENLYKTLKGGK